VFKYIYLHDINRSHEFKINIYNVVSLQGSYHASWEKED